eukprot:TRINITY_DN6101_c0_g1_i8.p1 TRINITY_DN6101_c0_g1~~TRINITY_DN6101_c0_g1_i8.p1  ORF type:complete len:1346 (+),score=255.07 TRINITY_DN6101_c0_g1_i8:84-4121(+)
MMEAMFRKFFFQTLPSVVTGGLTHNPEIPRPVRIVHGVAFLFFFLLPLILVLVAGSKNIVSATLYGLFVFLSCLVIKSANLHLQRMFDRDAKVAAETIAKQTINEKSKQSPSIDDIQPEAEPKSIQQQEQQQTDIGMIDIEIQEMPGPSISQQASPVPARNVAKSPDNDDMSDNSSFYSFVSSSTAGPKSTGQASKHASSAYIHVDADGTRGPKSIGAPSVGALPALEDFEGFKNEPQLRSRSIADMTVEIEMEPMSRPSPVKANTLDDSTVDHSASQSTTTSPIRRRIMSSISVASNWKLDVPPDLVPTNRAILEQVLDRDHSLFSVVCLSLLGGSSAWIGHYVLGQYEGFNFVLACFVLAGCHFSIFKSPQPDSNSPQIDNPYNGSSRALYFFIISLALALLEDYAGHFSDANNFVIYGINFSKRESLGDVKYTLRILILLYPIIFLFGVLPQAPTFFHYLFEQAHIHIFGGSGTSSLFSSVFVASQDVLAVFIIWTVASDSIADFESSESSADLAALFAISIFLAYLLSGLTSDVRFYLKLFSHHRYIILDDDIRLTGTKKHFLWSLLSAGVLALVWYIVGVLEAWPVRSTSSLDVVCFVTFAFGLCLHYIIPSMRRTIPFSIFASPFLLSQDATRDPVSSPTPTSWFDSLPLLSRSIESCMLYPLIFYYALVHDLPMLLQRWDEGYLEILVSILLFKLLRASFQNPNRHYIILICTILVFDFDYQTFSETFLVDLFVMTIIVDRVEDALLKLDFAVCYISPWNLPFGSITHLLLYPLAIPHLSFYAFNVCLSAILSAPLIPFIGSTIYIPGYVRPLRFWEKNYTSDLKGSSSSGGLGLHSERDPSVDSTNVNGLFYKQIFLELERILASDISSGRFGEVNHGDIFLLSNDKMTILLHIIEIGNGYCSFQLRGMEFKGTLCQQRELEAARTTHPPTSMRDSGPLSLIPEFIGLEDFLQTRVFTWTKLNEGLVVKTYSISLNPAQSSLQMFAHRKVLLSLYIKAVIFYATRHASLYTWMAQPDVKKLYLTAKFTGTMAAGATSPFSADWDEDYSKQDRGIYIHDFLRVYGSWIEKCMAERGDMESHFVLPRFIPLQSPEETLDLVKKFLYILCISARRVMTSHRSFRSPEVFISSYYMLFRGDIRITCPLDEWLLTDLDIMKQVFTPAARMALQLHQDTFISDDYLENDLLYELIITNEQDLIICPELDDEWSTSVLRERPQLLSLRRVTEPGQTVSEYYTVRLLLSFEKFQVARLNREAVKGLWASQQYELLFLQNQQSERGSIQQMKATLRNLVNQSCDLPIGYPIFVSEIGLSYTQHQHNIASFLWKSLFPSRKAATQPV